MNTKELNRVAKHMVMPKKGILAADESTGTIKKDLIQSMLNQLKKTEETGDNFYFKQKLFPITLVELFFMMKP